MEGLRHLEIEIATPKAAHPVLPSRLPERPNRTFDSEPAGIRDYGDALWHRKATVLSAGVLSALAACLLTLPMDPVYQAKTSLEIQGLNENFLHMNEVTPNAGLYSTEGYLLTQVDVLQSKSLLRRAADKTHFLERLKASESHSKFSFAAFGRSPKDEVADPFGEKEIKEITDRLKVRTSPPTRIVRISVDAPDAQLASDYANALASEYLSQALESRLTDGKRTSQWLATQLAELKEKLHQAEDRRENYMRSAGLMFLPDKNSVAEDRLRQLQEEFSKAQAERISKQSEYEIARAGDLESLPRVQDSLGLAETQQKLSVLQGQMAELSHALTPQHYKVQRLKAQIDELQAELAKGRQVILQRIQKEDEQASRREKLLEAACADQRKVVADQAQKTVQYDLLSHEADTYRGLYDSMLQRAGEAGVASAVQTSNARVIDTAEPPARPYKPDVLMNTALGWVTGLFFGIVYVCTRETRDRRVRRPGDVRMVSRTPELGVLPLSRGRVAEQGLVAGSVRSMLTSLVFTGPSTGESRIIVVTSAGASEGKTTIVQHLGGGIADIAGRVLLVDCDLHRPRLDALFGISNAWGMSNILHDTYPIDEYPVEALGIRCPNGVFVLPSGPRCEDSSDLLYSARLAQFLTRLKREFDVILIDTPPLLEIADARILGRLSNGVILVVRAGETSTEAVSQCTERLHEDGTLLLGTVLNGWIPKTAAYGYSRRRKGAAS